MHHRGLAVGIILLFVGVTIAPAMAHTTEKPLSAARDWLYVGGSEPGNHTTIQSAINDANHGDTVFVYNGTYYEHVVVNKTIDLIGENKETTDIDGGGTGVVVDISSDGVTISGFTVRNGEFGIHLYIFNNNTVTGNNANSNHLYGIILASSSNNTIRGNTASNNHIGIVLSLSSNNTVTGNNASHNEVGIWLDSSSNNTVTGNNATNREHGILIFHSNNNIFRDNNAQLNMYNGITLISCSNNTIMGNNASNNEYGIILSSSSNNTVTGNSASNNSIYGIVLAESNSNTVTGNTASNNDCGIALIYSSNNNHLYHDNLINNTQNAYDDGSNTWDNSYPSGGNYWSDYNGIDTDDDGIGDTPYDISGSDNQDRYPLMLPYGITKLIIIIQPVLFHLSMVIKNVGNITAFNVQWMITIDGFILFGKETSGFLPKNLLPGEEVRVTSNKLFIGFGKIEITATAWADNAPVVTEKVNGILLLFFFKIIGR